MIRVRQRVLSFVAGAIFTLCLGVQFADAGAILNLTQGSNPGGSIDYYGGITPMIGTNIPIYNVTGIGTANAGDHVVNGSGVNTLYGMLNFVTGDFTGTFGGSEFFAGGGSFSIRGNVPDAGILEGGGAVLLSGSFDPSFGVSILNLGTDTNQISEIPEPATLLLLGSGLTIIATIVRRRTARRS